MWLRHGIGYERVSCLRSREGGEKGESEGFALLTGVRRQPNKSVGVSFEKDYLF